MALPKLDTPKYQLTLPSTGEMIDYRPMLVKEQKVIMMAQESDDQKEIMNGMADLISSCTFGKLDARNLPMFDVEYIFLKIIFIALLKLPYFFAHLAEYIPGLPFKDLIQRPESSDITGKLVNLEKYFAFSFALSEKLLPVSFGLSIFNNLGEIFLIFFGSKKLISLNFPLLCVPTNIFFMPI